MPGRFLELSLPASDLVAALAFYESLGFVQGTAGAAWPHPYAVVSDGRVCFGLHGAALDEPRLTFVTPDLRHRLDDLEAQAIEIVHAQLDDLSLNEIEFRDPTGLRVRLVEARTFSPPALEPGHESSLGYFEEYATAAADLPAAGAFWERLGFVAFAQGADAAPTKVVASHRDLNLAFHDFDLPLPMPCFTAPDMAARVAALRERGHAFARRLPRELQARGAAVLLAPDGVQLLLLEAEA